MNKYIFSLVLFITVALIPTAAQTISFDNPDITFKFKKCMVSGKNAYVDFTITNESGAEFSALLIRNRDSGNLSYNTAVYDDEGLL